MPKIWVALLMTCFIGVAVFGFIGMGDCMSSHGLEGCIARTAQALSCPALADGLASGFFHANVFLGFSTAVFDFAFWISLFLFLLVFYAVFGHDFLFGLGQNLSAVRSAAYHFYNLNSLPGIFQPAWLELTEKRDPALQF